MDAKMSRKWFWGALGFFGGVMLVLMLQNTYLSNLDSVLNAQPYLAAAIFGTLATTLMAMETPIALGRPWWHIWRLYDPLTAPLFVYLTVTTIYFWIVWLSISQRYRTPDVVIDSLQFILYIGSALGFPAISYLVVSRWREMDSRGKQSFCQVWEAIFGFLACVSFYSRGFDDALGWALSAVVVGLLGESLRERKRRDKSQSRQLSAHRRYNARRLANRIRQTE